eukprot:4539587-Alexandrium_andersonii.AAC.1
MSASLVGSEMCIRDRTPPEVPRGSFCEACSAARGRENGSNTCSQEQEGSEWAPQNRPNNSTLQKAAECCKMRLSAALGGFAQSAPKAHQAA